MNIFLRQISIVITFTSPPLLSQYKVHRTDPLAAISGSLQLFSLQAEDGTTATLRCPRETKVDLILHTYISLQSNRDVHYISLEKVWKCFPPLFLSLS